jgi:polyphosphate glucokinase
MSQFLKPFTLAIDIGGTGLKMMVVDKNATPVTERLKVETPRPATPSALVTALAEMVKKQPAFDRVSVGFPGVVLHGIIKTAPNLDGPWKDYNLQKELSTITKKPTKVANDADVQGYGDVKGIGVEMVVTLGTGIGSALFVDGKLVPNLELGHHPFKNDQSYEDLLGKAALKKDGSKKWNKHLAEAIALLSKIFNYDTLYLGGGNAKDIKLNLDPNVHIASNVAGLFGGVKLWNNA